MLSVTDVHAGYGNIPVLNGATLSVAAGETVSILGRNGVGKTTLLKTIIGLLRARHGRLTLAGEDITDLPPHVRARRGIGYVPQGRQIFPELTVEENLRIGAELNQTRPWEAIDEVLSEFPVLRERYRRKAGTLSGGQQQMLALGRALVSNPKLLLMDEPSEGIQPSVVEELEVRIAALKASGGLSILLVEQNIEFAASLAARIYVMEKGRIAQEITPAQVFDEDIVRAYLAV